LPLSSFKRVGGSGLALFESKLLIASLFRNFEFELDPNQPPISYILGITLTMKDGLKMLPKLRTPTSA
jgi:hypothetical protein